MTKKLRFQEFYCPGCRGRVLREVSKRQRTRPSFCAKAGRKTMMRAVKHTKIEIPKGLSL